ncbi:aldo/keto reductase [Schaalia hyovaginalis]|uniref:aldo/keto reductase n=1 Tax=Schaalia hyovaginalis TaxID=29316 RepID=UPI0012B27319|nr:aldo/keto reductase [Schaalia hyovaginalis]MCF2710153.1 aldo/keto reductase [Schaalia hyovaginalis]MST64680.1 aldo/keto reductase [Schaalia hyovaginalis]
MEIRQCGTSGLRLSSVGLGALTWGRDTEAPEACDMLARFVEAGGTFVEVSPLDGDGRALDVLGSALARVGRHRTVLAMRGASRRLDSGSWTSSGARGDMLRSLDDALARLDIDEVDLWLASFDPAVPLEETLGALEAAHRSGRAHYIGLNGFGLWDAARAITLLDDVADVKPAVVQVPYSLLTAKDSSELVTRARHLDMGVIAQSPLAGGVLTGKYRHSTPPDSRAASPHLRALVDPHLRSGARALVEGVARAAEGLDRSALDLALSWVRDSSAVTSALIGPRTLRQLEVNLESGEAIPAPIRSVLDEIAGL